MAEKKAYHLIRLRIPNSQIRKIKEIQQVVDQEIGFKLNRNEFYKLAMNQLVDTLEENPEALAEILEKYQYI